MLPNQQSFFILRTKKKKKFAPQIAGKLVVVVQDKYVNNTSYLVKTTTTKIKLVENLGDYS